MGRYFRPTRQLLTGSLLSLAVTLQPVHASESICDLEQAPTAKKLFDQALKQENTLQQLMQQAIQKPTSGARNVLKSWKIRTLKPQEIAPLVRQKNLTLKQYDLRRKAATQSREMSTAAYDPSLGLSLSYSASRNRKRSETIARYREEDPFDEIAEGDWIDGEQVQAGDSRIGQTRLEASQSYTTCVVLDDYAVGSSCDYTITYSEEIEYASSESHQWYNSWNGSLSLNKLWDWGGSSTLSLSTTFTPYESSKSASVGINTAIYLGKREWASNWSASISTPLPYTKDYGELGSTAALAIEQAKLTERRLAETHQSALNTIISQSQIQYWELVRSLMSLASSRNYVQKMQKRVNHVSALKKEWRATLYDLEQARTLLKNAELQEEIAWTDLINASNTLVTQLNLPDNEIIVPVAFAPLLQEQLKKRANNKTNALEKPLQKALDLRPELKGRQLDIETQKVALKHAENQLLPDLSFNLSINGNQDSSVWAYDTFSDSIKALSEPDSIEYTVGFSLSIPWGKVSERAALSLAKSSLRQSEDRLIEEKINILQSVQSAVFSNQGASRQIDLACQNLQLAETAFNNTLAFSQERTLPEIEMVNRQRDLFSATTRFVNALIDQTQSDISLHKAQGTLIDQTLKRTQ
ncbi:TolC family protein [Magnetococcales bacterium HHB-1]